MTEWFGKCISLRQIGQLLHLLLKPTVLVFSNEMSRKQGIVEAAFQVK